MNIHISILLLAALLLLAAPAAALCLSAAQLNGLCTACAAGQQLSFGFCLAPMAGCISQLSNGLCTQCGAGYALKGYACSEGASSAAPSSNLDLYTENGPDKRYELLDYFLKQKYAASLRDKISDVAQLITQATTYGYIYALTYYNPFANTTLYRAEALVDYFYNITEFSFGPAPASPTSLLWFLNRQTVVGNLPLLAPALLNKVQQLSTNDYRLFFLDFTGRINVLDVQRAVNLSSAVRTFTSLTQLYYVINQDTVLNYVFSEFPTLQMHQNYTASTYSLLDGYDNSIDYFKFIFDNQIVITIQVNGLAFSVYSYDQPNSAVAVSTSQLGGFLPLLALTDALYLSVYSALLLKYPFLQHKNVQEVRYQLVAGTNFLITLNAQPFSSDSYLALVFQPLNGPPSFTSLLKNGVDITSTLISQPAAAYNYEADANFKALYTYFKQAISGALGGLLPIHQVFPSNNANGTTNYQVIYNVAESCQLQFSPTLANPYLILSYTAMGISLPTVTNASAQSGGNDVTRNAILSFLTQEKPTLFSSFLVISQSEASAGVYNVDLLTQYGTYFARVVNSGLFYLSSISMTSSNLCSDLSASEFTANTAVSALNGYLQANYPLNPYTLQLVQGFMSGPNINYRFVYSQHNNRY